MIRGSSEVSSWGCGMRQVGRVVLAHVLVLMTLEAEAQSLGEPALPSLSFESPIPQNPNPSDPQAGALADTERALEASRASGQARLPFRRRRHPPSSSCRRVSKTRSL